MPYADYDLKIDIAFREFLPRVATSLNQKEKSFQYKKSMSLKAGTHLSFTSSNLRFAVSSLLWTPSVFLPCLLAQWSICNQFFWTMPQIFLIQICMRILLFEH